MSSKTESGNTLVVTVSVVALILALMGSAVSYTEHVSRVSQRSRRTATAMEVADGHLEFLFTHWRNIYRKTWTTWSASQASGGTDYSLVGTNYFYTVCATCSPTPSGPAPTPVPYMTPSATPSSIPLPEKSLFPTEQGYTVTQYRVQAVDPMISLDANENALKETSYGSGSFVAMPMDAVPSAAYGPNSWQYSYFYLASVDVTVPTMTGDVTAKVRRVFEKRFDNPWTYAMFYVDDLELQPSAALSVTGPIHTNGNLYIGTSNFTAMSGVGYSGEYLNGYSPTDPAHAGAPTAPNFAANVPPSQEAPFLPFGWNLNIDSTSGNPNNESYHEIIERPVNADADPLGNVRLYNQASIKVLIDSSNNVTVYNASNVACTSNSTGNDRKIYDLVNTALTKNVALWDQRENTYVRTTNVDIGKITAAVDAGTINGFNGVIYFSDTTTNGTAISSKLGGNGTTVTTTERAIRLINGTNLPAGRSNSNNKAGLTVVCENPVYIQGDYNTGGTFNSTTKTYNTPSDNGTYTDPDYGSYDRKGAAVIADAVNVLSGAWSDANSNQSPLSQYKIATNTTINAALVGGTTASDGTNYSGGAENFIRLNEDWNKNNNHLTYYGSMVQLYKSAQGTGVWAGSGGQSYKAPVMHWYYDDAKFSNSATQPPGNLQIAAYLQQQRWYQVY